jgi:predicted DCC family thiol-disulfide oxidoreductase YuxK
MPLISNPGLPYIGWLLLAHACLPPAPFGAWAARGRADPGGGWRMPPTIFAAAWVLMALGYSYSGYTKLVSPSWLDGTAVERVLDSPLARPGPLRELLLTLPPWLLHVASWSAFSLELSFAPLAIFRRLRPWLWAVLLLMHLSLIALIAFADLSLGMVILHLFTFDPAWVPPRQAGRRATEMLYYDGRSGLARWLVRFVQAEDRVGDTFRFAPLDGENFWAAVPEGRPAERPTLTGSIAVRKDAGVVLTRSAAVRHILGRLGGVWRLLGGLAALIPAALLDWLYDATDHVLRGSG